MKPVEGEELLHELGRFARDEARRAEDGLPPLDTRRLLDAVQRELHTSQKQRTWLARLKNLFRPGISASLAVCCTAALFAWLARPTDALPRYEIEILTHVAAERGLAEPPKTLTAGGPLQLLLRPDTQTNLTPQVELVFVTPPNGTAQALSATLERAQTGAVRVATTLPNQPGQLHIKLASTGRPQPQTWTFEVLPGAR